MTEEIINFDHARRMSLKLTNEFAALVQPFVQFLGLHGITFHRMYADGRRVYFSNSHSWVDHFYDENYFVLSGFEKYGKLPDYTLWSRWPRDDDSFHKLIKDAKDNFDYGHGMALTRENENYVDTFSFRGFADDREVDTRYMNEFIPINKFFSHFLIVGEPLIKRVLERPLIIPEASVTPLGSASDRKEFFTESGEFPLYDVWINNIKLTRRQAQYLSLLIKGQSQKCIARTLGVSIDTVKYLYKEISSKTAVNYKENLVRLIFQDYRNRFFLLNLIDCPKNEHQA